MCREFVRVDDRLVHGQILLGWTRKLNLRNIVVGNDGLMQAKTHKKMFELMSTPQLRIDILPVDEVAQYVAERGDGEKTMVVFGSLADAWRYCCRRTEVKQVNVGCLRFSLGKQAVNNSVFIDEDDKRVLRRFVGRRIKVEARALPGDKGVDLQTLLK